MKYRPNPKPTRTEVTNYLELIKPKGGNEENVRDRECCDTCYHCKRAKGSCMGSTEYWCRIQNGKKSHNFVCDCYRKDTQ